VKKKMFVLFLSMAAAAGIGAFDSPGDAAEKEYLVIGGGSEAGIYYQVALDVCKLVNEKLGSHGYTCRGQTAVGSVINIKSMKRGWLDFAVIQSDNNWQAYNGKKAWKDKPYKGLRSGQAGEHGRSRIGHPGKRRGCPQDLRDGLERYLRPRVGGA